MDWNDKRRKVNISNRCFQVKFTIFNLFQNFLFFRLLEVDYCAAAVLVTLGIVVGKITISQQLIMCIFHVLIQTFNKYICEKYIKVKTKLL